MFNVVIFFTIIGSFSIASAAELPGWYGSLQPYLDRVAEENPAVGALSAKSEATDRYASSAGALPDPMIGIGIQALPTDGSFTREPMTQAPVVMLKQAIPFPGTLAAKSDALRSNSNMLAAQKDLKAQSSGLLLAHAAFQLRQLGQEREAVVETINSFDLLVGSIDARYRSGRGLRQDVDQLKAEIGRLRAELSRLDAAIVGAQTRWKKVLFGPVPDSVELASSDYWNPSASITDVVLTQNPMLLSKSHGVESSRQQLRQQRSEYGPDFAVELGYGVRASGRRDFLTAKLGLTVPLWAPWSQANRVKGANKNVLAATLEHDDAQAHVLATLEILLANHADATTRQKLYETSILPDAKAAQKSAQFAYESGGIDIFVPITATRRELTIQREYARVVAERQSVEAALLALQGKLTPEGTDPDGRDSAKGTEK